MVSMVLAAPMAVGGEVKEFGMGISAEEGKLLSGAGVVERVGRYDYLEGMADVGYGGGGMVHTAAKVRKAEGSTGKQVAKQAKKGKQKVEVESGEYKMSKAQEARIRRKALESLRKEREYRKSGRSVIDDYL